MVSAIRPRSGPDLFIAEGFGALAAMLLALLVVFLVQGSFTVHAGVQLSPPQEQPGENRRDPLVVRVSGAGTVHLRGEHVELPVLRRAIEEARFESPRSALVVLAEEGARASLLARVIDQCRLSGAPDIRFTVLKE